MPHIEDAVTVAEPLERVADALSSPEAGPLFAPPIVRITLDASADGRTADLTYEALRTAAGGVPLRTDGREDDPTRIAATFAGPGVEGGVAYRLAPADGGTDVAQTVDYEFTDWAAIDLLQPATTAHNDRQFAAQLATTKDLLEAGSRVLPGSRRGAGASEQVVRTR